MEFKVNVQFAQKALFLIILSFGLMDYCFKLKERYEKGDLDFVWQHSSFFLLLFFSILCMILYLVHKKFRSNPQNETTASSSSSSPNWKHQVFASFPEKYVGRFFLSHILQELKRKGIESIDNEINRSKSINSNLTEAIRGSRIVIVMLSKNYVSSSWCLNELVEIMKCSEEELSQLVVPIFYRLDPIDVKTQTGDFGKVFEKTCAGKTKEDIGRWSQALEKVATIAGYHVHNWDDESLLIQTIITDISNILKNFNSSSDFHGANEKQIDFHGKSNGLLHDVYIYCAETLQYSFASHLSVEFHRKHIDAFVNCNKTLDVLERSSASVVVFSKNYFSSTSFLDKLVSVLHCRRRTGQLVVPVFFGISPSEVVVQEHESMDRIEEWSSALQELRELPGHQSR